MAQLLWDHVLSMGSVEMGQRFRLSPRFSLTLCDVTLKHCQIFLRIHILDVLYFCVWNILTRAAPTHPPLKTGIVCDSNLILSPSPSHSSHAADYSHSLLRLKLKQL